MVGNIARAMYDYLAMDVLLNLFFDLSLLSIMCFCFYKITSSKTISIVLFAIKILVLAFDGALFKSIHR